MMPFGRAERLAVGAEPRAGEAQRVEVERHAAAIEHAQHHGLAVHRRHGRDAQVDVLAAHRELDAAVLRQAALGDVEARHDLDAREDRGAQLRRRRLDLAQHAVDAVAQAERLLERLDVDVGGALLDRARDDAVDDAHDRRLGGEVAQALDVVLGAELALLARGLDDLADRAAAAEHALERGLDVGRHADPGQHRLAGEQLHRADRVAVERVGHRDREAVLGLGERQDARLLEEVGAHPLAVQRQVGIVGLARERQLEQLGERLGDVALGDQAELRQQHVEALVVGLLDPLRAGEPGAVEPAALAQPLAERPVDLGCLVGQRLEGLRRHDLRLRPPPVSPAPAARTARPARTPARDGARRRACRSA